MPLTKIGEFGGIDSSNGNIKLVANYALWPILGKNKATGILSKGYNVIDNILSYLISPIKYKLNDENTNNIHIRNIYARDADGKVLETADNLMKKLEEQGVFVRGKSENPTNISPYEIQQSVKKMNNIRMEPFRGDKYSFPKDIANNPNNNSYSSSMVAGAGNNSSEFGINKIVDSFLTKFGLKEKLGWFGQSTAHLSVGVLGTILVGLGLYKTAKAFKAWKDGKKELSNKLMKEETNIPKTKEEAIKIKQKLKNNRGE